MAIREGKWDCSACGTTGVRGPLTRCMACGSSRPDNVHFYLSSNAPVVADPAAIARAKAGVDWQCSHCSASNKAWDTSCEGCGNPREGSDSNYQAQLAKGDGEGGYRAGTSGASGAAVGSVDGFVAHRNRRRRLFRWALLAAFLLTVVLPVSSTCAGFLFYETYDGWADSHEVAEALERRAALLAEDRCSKRIARVAVVVTKHSWARASHWDKYVWVAGSGWSLPGGSRGVSTSQRVHHTVTVPDGYRTESYYETETVGSESYVCGQRSLGNGYFEDQTCTRSVTQSVRKTRQVQKYREDPVYQTWYTYEVQRWIRQGELNARGEGLDRRWPEAPQKGADVRRIDDNEVLQLTLAERDAEPARTWQLTVSEERYLANPDGKRRDFGVDGCQKTYGLLSEVP